MFNTILKATTSLSVAVTFVITAAPAFAQDSVMFNYQGRVKVQGKDYSGDGQFKFAILSPDKSSVLWTNDGSSNEVVEPTTGVNLTVEDGVFNVIMGANGIMEPINSTIFQNREPLKLRTWFNDGVHGFELMQPDHNLINVNLISSETGGNDFTIYVNGQTGDDSNSGLKPLEAKKTIQGAVDIVPSRVMANLTIDVADGIYPESVLIYGINVRPGKSLLVKGDETWSPASAGSPKVIVSAADGTTTGVRQNALSAVQCTGIDINGLGFQDASGIGLSLAKGEYVVQNCEVKNNGHNGLNIGNQSFATVFSTLTTGNGGHGIGVNTNSRAILTSCISKFNLNSGLAVMDNSTAPLETSGDWSSNGTHGILCINYSAVGASNTYNGTIKNNKAYGIVAGWGGFYSNFLPRNVISGNVQGPQLVFSGGTTSW